MCRHLKCLDLASLLRLICGERCNGKVIINKGDLEEFGNAGFKAFLEYICLQDHIKVAIVEGELDLDPRPSHVLYRKLKQALKNIIWENEIMVLWFRVFSNKKLLPVSKMHVLGSSNHFPFCKRAAVCLQFFLQRSPVKETKRTTNCNSMKKLFITLSTTMRMYTLNWERNFA